MDSKFDDHQAVAEAVERGDHRDIIGGMWEEIGVLQFEFVTSRGLRPHHFLLDIGCGSLRGGVHFISYLEIGHYYGTDINRSLLDAGYEREVVPAGLSNRLPRRNLICDGDFNIAACNQILMWRLPSRSLCETDLCWCSASFERIGGAAPCRFC